MKGADGVENSLTQDALWAKVIAEIEAVLASIKGYRVVKSTDVYQEWTNDHGLGVNATTIIGGGVQIYVSHRQGLWQPVKREAFPTFMFKYGRRSDAAAGT